MKFNIFSNINESSVEDSKKEKVDAPVADTKISTDDSEVKELDKPLVPESDELSSIFDKSCPISGQVFDAMKEAAANPRNVKVVAMRESDETDAFSIYVEASEFINFSEAAELDISEAADAIIDTCKTDCPEIQNAEFHVVFPCDALNKGVIGGENLGVATKNDWAMELMRGCRRYGLKTNIGSKEPESQNDDAPVQQESSVFDSVIDQAIDKAEEAKEKIKVMDAAKAYRDKALEEYNKRKKAEKEEKYKEVKSKEKED